MAGADTNQFQCPDDQNPSEPSWIDPHASKTNSTRHGSRDEEENDSDVILMRTTAKKKRSSNRVESRVLGGGEHSLVYPQGAFRRNIHGIVTQQFYYSSRTACIYLLG